MSSLSKIFLGCTVRVAGQAKSTDAGGERVGKKNVSPSRPNGLPIGRIGNPSHRSS